MSDRKSILIIGAKSEIAAAVAYKFAANNFNIILASRDLSGLNNLQQDLSIKFNIDVKLCILDILDAEYFSKFIDNLDVLPDIVICAVGLLGDQIISQSDQWQGSLVLRTNFEGPALFLGMIANQFTNRGHGTIIGISSVAGERGRQSNYFYGSAKAGLTSYLSGLRNRLADQNVHVITIIPGYVNTKMIDGMSLPKFLISQPDELAKKIYDGVQKNKDVIYSSFKWHAIMSLIKLIPERAFKKLKL
jgi:decaprenylphospho-beta-D-erythro-pentofuranosid-2-ulose 2-reductase